MQELGNASLTPWGLTGIQNVVANQTQKVEATKLVSTMIRSILLQNIIKLCANGPWGRRNSMLAQTPS